MNSIKCFHLNEVKEFEWNSITQLHSQQNQLSDIHFEVNFSVGLDASECSLTLGGEELSENFMREVAIHAWQTLPDEQKNHFNGRIRIKINNPEIFEAKVNDNAFKAAQVFISMTVTKIETMIPVKLLEYQDGITSNVICEAMISEGMQDIAGVELAIVRKKDADFMEVHLISKK